MLRITTLRNVFVGWKERGRCVISGEVLLWAGFLEVDFMCNHQELHYFEAADKNLTFVTIFQSLAGLQGFIKRGLCVETCLILTAKWSKHDWLTESSANVDDTWGFVLCSAGDYQRQGQLFRSEQSNAGLFQRQYWVSSSLKNAKRFFLFWSLHRNADWWPTCNLELIQIVNSNGYDNSYTLMTFTEKYFYFSIFFITIWFYLIIDFSYNFLLTIVPDH